MGIIEDEIKEAAVRAGYDPDMVDAAMADLHEKGIINKKGDGFAVDPLLVPSLREHFEEKYGKYKRLEILGKARKVRTMDLVVLGLSFKEMTSLPKWEEKYGT